MKKLLFAATTIFCGAVVFYVGAICYAIYQRLSWRKTPIEWDEFNPVKLIKECFSEKGYGITGLVNKVLPFVLLVGLVNMALSILFSSTTIGAFYEKSEYREDYEAVLYIDDKAVFCIADVQKWTDEGEASYWVEQVHLPYGGSEYVDAEYDVSAGKASLSLGEYGWGCDISLKTPATQSSYDLLGATVVSNYGEFCGSRGSNIYHYPNCWNVKNIKTSNFVYFETEKEAEILGYELCDVCRDLGPQEDDAPLSFSEWTKARKDRE